MCSFLFVGIGPILSHFCLKKLKEICFKEIDNKFGSQIRVGGWGTHPYTCLTKNEVTTILETE